MVGRIASIVAIALTVALWFAWKVWPLLLVVALCAVVRDWRWLDRLQGLPPGDEP